MTTSHEMRLSRAETRQDRREAASIASSRGANGGDGLRECRLLATLGEEERTRLSSIGKYRKFVAGDGYVLGLGGANDVYFVLAGAFRLSKMTVDGRFATIRRAGVGDQFGEFAVLESDGGGAQKTNFVHCEKTGLCFVLPGDAFRALVADQPRLAGAVLRELAAATRDLAERLCELATLDVRSRLLAELSRLAQRGAFDGAGSRIEPAPTHEALGAQIGASREVVSRHLKELERRGLIRVPRRGSLEIVDVAAISNDMPAPASVRGGAVR